MIEPLAELEPLSLRKALRRILDDLHVETGTVHALGGDGELHLKQHLGSIPEDLLPVIRNIPVGKGMAGLAAQRKEPVQICNLQTDASGDARPGARATGMQGAICVPMWKQGRIVGVLGVALKEERDFSADEAAWLERAGASLALNL